MQFNFKQLAKYIQQRDNALTLERCMYLFDLYISVVYEWNEVSRKWIKYMKNGISQNYINIA